MTRSTIHTSLKTLAISLAVLTLHSCDSRSKDPNDQEKKIEENKKELVLIMAFDEAIKQSKELQLTFPESGRYQIDLFGSSPADSTVWIEDHINNTDDRSYDISGKMKFKDGIASIYGSPISKGEHQMKIHLQGQQEIDSIRFQLMHEHSETPLKLIQSMEGEKWELVWDDEFDGQRIDTTKWAFNVGNWGWGNNELQYYTDINKGNAFLKDGSLHIQARKDEDGNWTSARLTTAGKTSFTYGKIEFRAKVPTSRGVWSAGWLLGDTYVDELSWPYCGEIDVLECVGYEINDTTGNGVNHGTCHTRKYYFKQGNQIGSEINVENMNKEFHTYSIEWDSTEIKAFVDEEHYFTYDKNADSLEWPFHKAQNIIVNLAIGGGWGGAKGIDSSFNEASYILDYIRVYEKK